MEIAARHWGFAAISIRNIFKVKLQLEIRAMRFRYRCDPMEDSNNHTRKLFFPSKLFKFGSRSGRDLLGNFNLTNLFPYRDSGSDCFPRPASSFPPSPSCDARAWWYLRESRSHRECNRAGPKCHISSIWPFRRCAWRVTDTVAGWSRPAWWSPSRYQRCNLWPSTESSPTWGFRFWRCCSFARTEK